MLGVGEEIHVTIEKAEVQLDPLPVLLSTGMINNYMMLLLTREELGRNVQNLNSCADLWRPFDSEPLHPAVHPLVERTASLYDF